MKFVSPAPAAARCANAGGRKLSAGDFAQVQSDVEALGVHGLFENLDHLLDHLLEVQGFAAAQFVQAGLMADRSYQ